jgi:hypothetical protein
MAFHFATVDLKFNDDEGNMVTSAVLTPAVWTPAPEATPKKQIGKNQTLALEMLKHLETEKARDVSLDVWRENCKAVGMERSAFWHVKNSLEKSGLIQIDSGNVRCKGVALSVENRGLLYSPPVSTHVSTLTTPVENITVSTPFNTFNAPELFQPDGGGNG